MSPAGTEGGAGTILAVEDEAMLLDILTEELEDCGYRVLSALTGEKAFALLREKASQIDLLITDIRLPGDIDGWDVAEEARRLRPTLPVIYVTGYFAQKPREVSGGVIIMKPYRPSALITAARKLGLS